MPTLECISFNTSGWTPEEASEDQIAWTNESGDRLEYRLNHAPPVLPVLYPLEGFQRYVSENWQDPQTAVISADVLSIRGTFVVRSILKHQVSDDQQVYHGRICLPFRDFSYEIRITTTPLSLPSERETEVRSEMDQHEGGMQTWQQDPYCQDRKQDYLCSESDNEEYDSRFSDDPLALLRQEMVKIIASIQSVREVRNSVPFQGNISE